MKININDLYPILLEWVDTTILPKANPWMIAGITFSLAQGREQINNKLTAYMGMFADANGDLDLDITFNNLNATLDKVSGKLTIPYLGWDFDKDDLAIIRKLAEKRAK